MSANNSNALAKRDASTALMAPPPAPKRIKRPAVVLDEDTYTSAISHIIRRDFFPGLAEADAQREYLNAVDSKDKTWIREASKNLTQAMTPAPHGSRNRSDRTRFDRPSVDAGKTPSTWGADTPVTVRDEEPEDEEYGKLDNVDLDMSLGAFQAKYTSEDQESFSQIIDKQNEARFSKNTWLREGNRYASKQRIAQQKVIEARNARSDSQDLVLSKRPSQNLDDRPAAPTSHKHTAFNSLMFEPDGVEDWAPTRAQRAETASLAPPKKVLYNNTRLTTSETHPARPPSPTLSAVRAAIAGNPRLNPSEGGYTGNETPRVKGYAFVDAHPPSDEDDDDAPTDLLSRYGLDKGSSATPFSMAESSDREKMHHRMVDRIGAKRSNDSNNSYAKPSGPGLSARTPGTGLGIFTSETPRFASAPTPAARLRASAAGNATPRREKGDLTPAAQRLFEKVGGGTPRVGKGGFGERSAREEWTPASRARRKA